MEIYNMIIGRRQQIKDNNNYIKHRGKITFVCEKCGHIHSYKLQMTEKKDRVKANHTCDICNRPMMQVDNAMSEIVSMLIRKGYKVSRCCEGHWVEGDHYNMPYIYLYGYITDVRPLIPISFLKNFNIYLVNGYISLIAYRGKEFIKTNKRFEEVKEEVLELLTYLVKSLPDCPFQIDK